MVMTITPRSHGLVLAETDLQGAVQRLDRKDQKAADHARTNLGLCLYERFTLLSSLRFGRKQ
jgi:hypothetical protein